MSNQQPPQQLSVESLKRLSNEELQRGAHQGPISVDKLAGTHHAPAEKRRDGGRDKVILIQEGDGGVHMVRMLSTIFFLLLVVAGAGGFAWWQLQQPGGPIWARDKVWHTQRQLMRLAVAEVAGEADSQAGLGMGVGQGVMSTTDAWGNRIHKKETSFVSAGADGAIGTDDDLWASFSDFEVGGPLYKGRSEMEAMTADFPAQYRTAFTSGM